VLTKVKAVSALLLLGAGAAWAAQVEISVQFDPEQHIVSGSQWVSWEAPPQVATFALLANLGREENPYLSGRALDTQYVWGFDPAWTEVRRVVWEGEVERELEFELLPAPPALQTYSLEDVLLRVPLPGGEGRLRIDFATRFPHVSSGEAGRLGNIYTWRFGWHPIPVELPAGEYWPLVLPAHHYRVELTLPTGWRAFLPGEVEEEAGEEEVRWRASFAIPVRSISLYFGPEEELTPVELPLADLELVGVAPAGEEEALRALLTYVPEILRHYGERFGPYPHPRLLVVHHPNRVGLAMAADGVVFLPQWYFDRQHLTASGILSRFGQFILAHELAHQWWGIGVGVDFNAENWLSEGLAQYASISWFEEKFGPEGGNLFVLEREGLGEALVESLIGFVNLREHFTELPYMDIAFQGFDEAVVKPLAEVRYGQATGIRIYDKGYLVLRALAHLVGEEAFDRVLAKVAASYRGRLLTVEELKALLEEETGEEWGWFFQAWVWGEAQADYAVREVRRGREGERYRAEVYLTRSWEGFLPVEVEVRGPEEQRELLVWPAGEEESTVLVFETDFPVREVVVDPGHYVLDHNRLNNVWPTRYVLAIGKNQLPLDGYLVRGDPETRAVQIQYLNRFGWAIYPEALAVQGFVRYGREATVWGFAQINDTLTGQLSLALHLWDQPETGQAGEYWVPAGDLVLSLARRPYWQWGVGITWQQFLPRVFWGQGTLVGVPGAGERITFTHLQELSLAPHTYLQLGLGLGLVRGTLPQELRLRLGELYTVTDGPQGQRKLFLGASLWLPPHQEPYHLAGVALVSRVVPRLYLSWGKLWSADGPLTTRMEVGGELLIRCELLGGTMALTGVVGLAWPLPEGQAVFYFGILP
jgi:hypothetical protein